MTVIGDATAAYLPELGLKSFTREFAYKTGVGFQISDQVETTKPAVLTWLLHADKSIEKTGDNRFVAEAGGVKLMIDASLETQNEAGAKLQSAIETNTVTAPGPPGAVDKGERQARGQKLVLSTTSPTTSARFRQRLSIQE